ncbi:4698_t:CDS:1 [Ambispora leptoticha]|uniref:4698_t:CDS:1 n=1 Tax=Ambispora leptoticha TaxID=144679 RepID=A0A9N9GCJ0_9GLOM|nr:4698_t:CDS:1 [Ambispora leptoticha]
MGNVDSIPVVSQTKSLVQVIGGDAEGARRTQENFSRGAPIVSQARSLVEVISGDEEAARKTQEYFAEEIVSTATTTPLLGHAIGAAHYIVGDVDRGDAAMKAASRTTGVTLAGIGGFAIGGPFGAASLSTVAGAAMDGIITGVDTAAHNEYRPYGYVAAGENIKKNGANSREIFDFAMIPAGDAMTGLNVARNKLIKTTRR